MASETLQVLSLAVATAAFGTSVWFARKTNRTAEAQRELSAQWLALEVGREQERQQDQRKARMSARLLRDGSYRLVVRNDGPSEARAIAVFLDDVPLLEHPATPEGEGLVTLLGPGVDASYFLAIAMGNSGLLSVRLEWEDDSGAPGVWMSQLNLW